MAKISVVIPVYNVEKYLDRCVESIINQTYTDLEIILVDDGSLDNCPKLCDEWTLRDSRIRTVHRENGGQSCARNTGLSVATGDYVVFVDSDDWIEENTYEYCLHLLDRYKDADVVQFDIMFASSFNTKAKARKEHIDLFRGKEILEHYMEASTKDGGMYSMCTVLVRTDIAKRHSFRIGKINEDIDYKFKILKESNLWIVSNQIKYCYWQEGNSTSSGKVKVRDFQLYEAAEELYQLCLSENNKKIEYYGRVKMARTPFSLLSRIAIWGVDNSTINEAEVTKLLIKELRHVLPTLIGAPIPYSRKYLAILMAVNFSLTKSILKLCRRIAYI